MKIGTRVRITMGMHKGQGVVVSKKGTAASKDELVIKTSKGKTAIINKNWVQHDK